MRLVEVGKKLHVDADFIQMVVNAQKEKHDVVPKPTIIFKNGSGVESDWSYEDVIVSLKKGESGEPQK